MPDGSEGKLGSSSGAGEGSHAQVADGTMVMVEGSGILPETAKVEDGSTHAKKIGGVVAEMEALGEVS